MGVVKRIVLTLIIMAAAVAGYVIQNSIKNPPSEVIKIGYIGPLTGDAMSYGIPISDAVRMAVDVINQSGGIDGKPIEILYENGECESEAAQKAAEKLVHMNRVRIIIGGICSGETLAILPVTESKEVLLLSPSSSSPDLSGAGKYFFRNTPSDLKGGEKLAQLVVEKYEHTNIAVITEKTSYAQAFARVFKQNIRELGGELVADETFAPEADDFRSILAKIEKAAPDALVVNPQTEKAGGTIVKQAREIGITAQVFGSNVLSGSQSMEIAGEHIEGLVFVDAPGLSRGNPKATAFLNEYRSAYGEPGIEFYAGAAYDIVHILTQAMKEAGTSTDTKKIRRYLSTMKNFNGVAGTYRFDHNGDPEGLDFITKKIHKGEIIDIE